MVSSTQFATSLIALYFFRCLPGSCSTTFTIVNKCSHEVFPAISSNAGTSPLSTTRFTLQSGKSTSVVVAPGCSGKIWAGTLCSEDSNGKFSCVTGDCGSSSTVGCTSVNPAPPTTVAEFNLNGDGGLDFFDVSLVNGYNLAMMVEPEGGTGNGNCMTAGCLVDWNSACPTELKVTSGGEVVACQSACGAFGDPKYCCTGSYSTPEICKPSNYSQLMKDQCPYARTYAHDYTNSIFTCASADYNITFCPTYSTTRMNPVRGEKPTAAMDNSKGEGLNNTIISAVVGAVVTCMCGVVGYYLRFFLKRMCGINVPRG